MSNTNQTQAQMLDTALNALRATILSKPTKKTGYTHTVDKEMECFFT